MRALSNIKTAADHHTERQVRHHRASDRSTLPTQVGRWLSERRRHPTSPRRPSKLDRQFCLHRSRYVPFSLCSTAPPPLLHHHLTTSQASTAQATSSSAPASTNSAPYSTAASRSPSYTATETSNATGLAAKPSVPPSSRNSRPNLRMRDTRISKLMSRMWVVL